MHMRTPGGLRGRTTNMSSVRMLVQLREPDTCVDVFLSLCGWKIFWELYYHVGLHAAVFCRDMI